MAFEDASPLAVPSEWLLPFELVEVLIQVEHELEENLWRPEG